jgi:methyl-accepting chemotaxis protein
MISKRFYHIAQILFTSIIDEEEKQLAQKAVSDLNKTNTQLKHWLDAIEKNLKTLAYYKEQQGTDKALVVVSDKFKDISEKQKANYERLINELKSVIENINNFQDVEMQDMIVNLTKASEEFTGLYNEINDLPHAIGEDGFLDAFIDTSKKLLLGKDSFIEVIDRIKTYIQKNILDEQSLS